MSVVYFQLLILVLAANGGPILGRLLLRDIWTTPLDFGACFHDGRPWLGPSKTYRGVVFGVVLAGLFAEVMALPYEVGLLVGGLAMCGDSASSFVKRRLGVPSEAMAFGLDQIPESLLPLVGVKSLDGLSWVGIGMTVGAFLVLELLLSFGLYRVRIRKHPY